MLIKRCESQGSYREGTVTNVTRRKITQLLGFPPNVDDDAKKVTASWAFTVDGQYCAVWDYKGSFKYKLASCYGPHDALTKVFGKFYIPEKPHVNQTL
jgi:hypothetical protein